MTSSQVVDIIRQTFMTTFWLSIPLLLVGFAVGVIVSLIQIVTSMQDPSFGSIPRLGAFLFGIVLFLPWMLSKMIAYTTALLGDFGRYAH